MFGRVIKFGCDQKRDHEFAVLRQQMLGIVLKAKGHDGGRWDGPGAKTSCVTSVVPSQLIPQAKKLFTAELAHDADINKNTRAELVGAMTWNEIHADDINPYLLIVVGAIEAWLGHPSESVRKMASATGTLVHENIGNGHVRNQRWDDAETEFRLALDMCHLAPDGREVMAMLKVGDMVRLQHRDEEAGQLFREALRLLDRLDPKVEFYGSAVHIANQVRSRFGDYLK